MTDRPGSRLRDATILDIAASLGLSASTVSRALSDHPHVNEITKARVREAAARLAYVPNGAAKAMQRQRSHLVGLIIPDIENAFYARVAKVVSDRCARAAHQLVLAITEDNPELELSHVRALRQARAAAVAITPSMQPRAETLALLSGLRAVQLVRAVPGLPRPAVLVAEHFGTMRATEHLIAAGHRRIAFVGGATGYSTGAERLRGFTDALRLADLGAEPGLVALGPPRASFGEEAVSRLIAADPPPTAVIAAGYELTVGALKALMGLRPEPPPTLVGYGDGSTGALWIQSLTTITPPVEEMAVMIADLLLRDPGEESGTAPVIFAPALVVRP